MSIFLEKFTCRQITICGALLSSCAFIVSIFSPTVDILILTYGVLGGRSYHGASWENQHLMWFPNRFDTNRDVQAQLEILDLESRGITIRAAKTKALISFAVTAFVFAYADCWFSHEAAELLVIILINFYTC